jgi:gamma-glutamyl-gamma-aminobutyrate hydrolase PuuD
MTQSPQRKCFVVGPSHEYANWTNSIVVTDMKAADFVLFTGGEDVSPSLYGKNAHPTTVANMERDIKEMAAYRMARAMDKPLLGICRGAQFLCVMAGGILVQHQRHPSNHKIRVTSPIHEITVTSSHHQRQYPFERELSFMLLGWCALSPFSYGEGDEEIGKDKPEVEIAYYPKIKALAIQSHPEWQTYSKAKEDTDAIGYFQELLDKLLKNRF